MIFDSLLAKVAPYECLGCAKEGKLLCADCGNHLQRVPSRCYRCHKLTDSYKTCQTCRTSSDLYGVLPYAIYDGLAKQLVLQLKFHGAQAAAQEITDLTISLLPTGTDFVVVPVPTATSRTRKRGYDQAVVLARALARSTGFLYAPGLRRLGQHEQLGASRQQRVTQLSGAYRLVIPEQVKDRHVLLVDDVTTTGATLEAAAKAIKAAGAKRISALVFAQA